MKKYIIFIFALFFIINSKAEHISSKRSNPNYKNLKVYAKVLKRYGNTNLYLAQIEIVNTGSNSVSFWEETTDYAWIFSFTAAGVSFVNKYGRLYYEKKITKIPIQKSIQRKVKVLPHTKYIIKTQFYINNKERFLKTNGNLRLTFFYNDADLNFMEDDMRPKIISENVIDYKW